MRHWITRKRADSEAEGKKIYGPEKPVPKAENFNVLEAFKSMAPGHIYYYNDNDLVKDWLRIYSQLFKNSQSILFGCKQQFKLIAQYWLRHGRHNPDCDNPDIIYGQRMWNHFITQYVEWYSF